MHHALDRRTLLAGSAASIVMAACSNAREPEETGMSTTANTISDGATDWANLSKAEWKERLTEAEFHVLRDEGTERPGSSPLDKNYDEGTYVCAGCALPLFESDMKFDSGTGWPSFFRYIDGALETKRDFKMVIPRTEYHCARCGGHQGHVFKDGPAPTGLRYCNNGVALDFVPADSST